MKNKANIGPTMMNDSTEIRSNWHVLHFWVLIRLKTNRLPHWSAFLPYRVKALNVLCLCFLADVLRASMQVTKMFLPKFLQSCNIKFQWNTPYWERHNNVCKNSTVFSAKVPCVFRKNLGDLYMFQSFHATQTFNMFVSRYFVIFFFKNISCVGVHRDNTIAPA